MDYLKSLLGIFVLIQPSLAANCHANGVSYSVGDTWVHTDGCNLCQCETHGIECTQGDCTFPHRCYYKGRTYTEGDNFKSSDGCNHCMCTLHGTACTGTICSAVDPTTTPATSIVGKRLFLGQLFCHYGGTDHKPGSSFPSSDGCNTCYCSQGLVACTEKFCPKAAICNYNGASYNEGDGFQSVDGCNQCLCGKGGSVSCTDLYCWQKETTSP